MEKFVERMVKESENLGKRIGRLGHAIEKKTYKYDKQYDQELVGKIRKCEEFITKNDKFKKLPENEQNLLKNQLESMKNALPYVKEIQQFDESKVKALLTCLQNYKYSLDGRIALHSNIECDVEDVEEKCDCQEEACDVDDSDPNDEAVVVEEKEAVVIVEPAEDTSKKEAVSE